MSAKKYILDRDVLRKECPWLDEDMLEGDIVYEYTGHTYGIISPNGIAFTTIPNKTPFFGLPKDSITEYTEFGYINDIDEDY